jgi:hypothetical protein
MPWLSGDPLVAYFYWHEFMQPRVLCDMTFQLVLTSLFLRVMVGQAFGILGEPRAMACVDSARSVHGRRCTGPGPSSVAVLVCRSVIPSHLWICGLRHDYPRALSVRCGPRFRWRVISGRWAAVASHRYRRGFLASLSQTDPVWGGRTAYDDPTGGLYVLDGIPNGNRASSTFSAMTS